MMGKAHLRRCYGLTLAVMVAVGVPVSAQLQPERIFILIGPPGSGKTVQADVLRKQYKIPAVSMSRLLQQEVNRKSQIGRSLIASLDSGELIADGPANDIINGRLLRADVAHGFILDGYPATEGQARSLDQWLIEHKLPKPIVVVLSVPDDVSRNRLVRRKRADDNPSNIERRLMDYGEVGRLVEQWYGPERIVRVDGTGTQSDVAARIAKGVDTVQSNQALKLRSPGEGGLLRREPEAPATEQKQ